MTSLASFSSRVPQISPAHDVLSELPVALLLLDETGSVSYANDAAVDLLGADPVPGIDLYALVAGLGIEGSPALDPDGGTAASELHFADGRTVEARLRPLGSGGAAMVLNDVTGLMREAELARTDPLTGLANRTLLHAELVRLTRIGTPFALFCLDLDRFKAINDTLGHPMGDALLRKVAERLRSAVGPDDLVARLGGDEFAIVRLGVGPQEAQSLAARIVDLVGRTYVTRGHLMNVGGSVGVALAPADGDDADQLVKHADLALYRAKAEGRGTFCFFEPEMDARMQERRALEIDLRRAMAFREFELAYQPQVELDSGAVVGFEALLRWRNPERGLVPPGDFIGLAEEVGLIVPIGAWVLRTACAEASRWSRPVSVAVNLSPVQFRSAGLVEAVTTALAYAELDPARLELEITEGALLDDTDTVVATLTRLRALGVRVSMDDFGTGYSSLSYLQKFPFDKIKIDQSFVREMASNPDCGAIVRAVANLGASLGMKTTAEGVETQEQLDAIRAEGCSEVQGYFTGRPLTPADAAALLSAS